MEGIRKWPPYQRPSNARRGGGGHWVLSYDISNGETEVVPPDHYSRAFIKRAPYPSS